MMDITISAQKVTIDLPDGKIVVAEISVPHEIMVVREHDSLPNEIVYSEIIPEEGT